MFCALAHGKVAVDCLPSGGYSQVQADIQTLNRHALAGELDMTQISAAAYPQVSDYYRITSCGSSMGLNYGPIVVTVDGRTQLRRADIAIPGEHTTAFLLGRIFLPAFQPVEMVFDQVLPAVRDGSVQAGIVIHEGQLGYGEFGLAKQVDLGERWFADTGLPLPLGINVVRRNLPESVQQSLAVALRSSICWADANREQALTYARTFAPTVDAKTAEEFTRMYVNDLTLDMGTRGLAGLEALFQRAADAGCLADVPPLDVLCA